MFDVFVSYRHSDGVIVRRLVAALERRGLQVWFDETAIPDFGGITDEARRGLAESKALLVFYSATYPHSSPCQWELTLAFLASARLGDPRRRVLVVNPELAPSHIEPVELRDALYQMCIRDRLVRRLVGRCLHGDGRSEYYEDEDYGTKRDKGIPVILLAGTANANCGS